MCSTQKCHVVKYNADVTTVSVQIKFIHVDVSVVSTLMQMFVL